MHLGSIPLEKQWYVMDTSFGLFVQLLFTNTFFAAW